MTGGSAPASAHPVEHAAELVGRLVVGPAGLVGAAAVLAGGLRLPGLLAGALIGTVALGAGAVWVVRVLSFPARLGRAMVDAGLTGRDPAGRRLPPRRGGRAARDGSAVTTRWTLPPGVSLRDVLEHKEAVEERARCELWCWVDEGRLVVEAQRGRIPEHVGFDAFYGLAALPGPSFLGLGVGRRGPLTVDLRAHPHLLVGGITGGGKSVLLRQALMATLLKHGPDQLRVLAVDLKGGVELGLLDGLPHLLRPVVTTLEMAAEALEAVRIELDARLAALRAHAVSDLDGMVAAGQQARPRVLVVVDELAELTTRDPGESRAARDAQRAAVGRLCEIARLGRAVGIHLLVCTQRPDAEAVPGQLKANLAGTVAFRVRSRVNSEILLDDDRAARLSHRPGRALWVHERVEEFQAVDLGLDGVRQRLAARWLRPTTGGGGALHVTPPRQTPQASWDEGSRRSLRGRSEPTPEQRS